MGVTYFGRSYIVVCAPTFFCVLNQIPCTNRSSIVLLQFCMHCFDYLMDSQSVWCCNQFLLMSSFFFPISLFRDLRSNTIEKKGIISFGRNSRKRYSSEVLNDSEVTFLSGEIDTIFWPCPSCVLLIRINAKSKKYVV